MFRRPGSTYHHLPALIHEAVKLDTALKKLPADKIGQLMHVSPDLATKTCALIAAWNAEASQQTAALDAFVGDIYRGLDAPTLTQDDRAFADQHLVMLSGLYGAIRALDGVSPYRLELMYGLSGQGYSNLYQFWGRKVADQLPATGQIFNLASAEYMKLVAPFVDSTRVVSPLFLTQMSPDVEPTFVAVHAKVTRGAYARWLITSRADDTTDPTAFGELGYKYSHIFSKPGEPAFVRSDKLLTGKSKLLG